MTTVQLIALFFASFCAGISNAIAGGGSFMTFPALLLTGLDPRAANITSAIGLFPMQINSGYALRKLAAGTAELSFRTLIMISLLGGAVGSVLLLLTPVAVFAKLVPWLILFATVAFAIGSFRKKAITTDLKFHAGRYEFVILQFFVSIYGGYFGGGVGFFMLAALALTGMNVRQATSIKSILVAAMNAAAVTIFFFSPDVAWLQAGICVVASLIGAQVGIRMVHKVDERILQAIIITIGLTMTVVLFIK